MKSLFLLLILFASWKCALGQEVHQKDGKVLRTVGLRRDGGVVFAKLNTQGDNPETVMIAVNSIERIAFPQDLLLRELGTHAYAGDALSVINKIAQAFAYARQWSDIEGNTLPDVFKLLIPSFIAEGKTAELSKFLDSWVSKKDPDLDRVVSLLRLRERRERQGEFEMECKSLTDGSSGELGAAVAWILLGREALEAGQWASAIRAFTSVRLFSQNWRVLQPVALLGAIEACRGNGNGEQASIFASDLESEYPQSRQAGIARSLPPLSRASP